MKRKSKENTIGQTADGQTGIPTIPGLTVSGLTVVVSKFQMDFD